MTLVRRWLAQRCLSLVFSLCMLSLALLLLWLSDWIKTHTADTLTVREVSTVNLPPPPPPPAPQQQQVVNHADVVLAVEGQGAVMPVIEVEAPHLDLLKPKEVVIDTVNTQWQSLEVDWNALDLHALDSMPSLLTPLKVTFPKSLTRKGVKTALVKLDIMIDERGLVTLIDVASNPYPELNAEIQKLVSNSRFTPPQKDNEPARARFIWPIEISS